MNNLNSINWLLVNTILVPGLLIAANDMFSMSRSKPFASELVFSAFTILISMGDAATRKGVRPKLGLNTNEMGISYILILWRIVWLLKIIVFLPLFTLSLNSILNFCY